MPPPSDTSLSLRPLIGPNVGDFSTQGEGPATIGRAAFCELALVDDAVSRRHATLVRRNEQWFVIDEGSSGGTFVNGQRIEASVPAPLTTGDLIRIGPWTFRAAIGAPVVPSSSTIDDSAVTSQRVQRAGSGRPGRSERRLRALSDCIAKLNAAPGEGAAAKAALEFALLGSGFSRGALLRRIAGPGAQGANVEVIASLRADPNDSQEFSFSRTLIEQANAGETVVLSGAPGAGHGQSIAELGIHSALCVPIGLGGSVTGYLYLDARGRESLVKADAASFCESVALAYGLCVASLQRAQLERRQADLHSQLAAARDVQQLVMPPDRGEVGCISYAARSLPGSFVAGDLFDVVDVEGEGVAVCVGDISGHGIGSAMLMATAQAFLAAELRRLRPGESPVIAVEALNKYLCERSLGGRFLSLWVGVLVPDGSLTYIDAGHGHWAHLRADGSVAGADMWPGGIPVGIDPGAQYALASTKLARGERMLVYSDGIIEQRNHSGEPFGTAGLEAALRGTATPEEDIARLFDALARHSPGLVLDDDATAASLGLTST